MSVQNNLIITYFKSKPQGNAIIFLLLIETIIVIQDLLDAVDGIFNYPFLAIIVMLDIGICVLLYMIIKTPNKMKYLYSDTQSVLIATLKEITRLSFIIFALEIIWFGIIIFIMRLPPGFLNSVALFAPLIIGLVGRSSVATALNNPNFIKELELAANPPDRVHLSSHRIYQQQGYQPHQSQSQYQPPDQSQYQPPGQSQYEPPDQSQYQPPEQSQYESQSEIPSPLVEDGPNRCPHCDIEAEGENYCSNCGGSLAISKK